VRWLSEGEARRSRVDEREEKGTSLAWGSTQRDIKTRRMRKMGYAGEKEGGHLPDYGRRRFLSVSVHAERTTRQLLVPNGSHNWLVVMLLKRGQQLL